MLARVTDFSHLLFRALSDIVHKWGVFASRWLVYTRIWHAVLGVPFRVGITQQMVRQNLIHMSIAALRTLLVPNHQARCQRAVMTLCGSPALRQELKPWLTGGNPGFTNTVYQRLVQLNVDQEIRKFHNPSGMTDLEYQQYLELRDGGTYWTQARPLIRSRSRPRL